MDTGYLPAGQPSTGESRINYWGDITMSTMSIKQLQTRREQHLKTALKRQHDEIILTKRGEIEHIKTQIALFNVQMMDTRLVIMTLTDKTKETHFEKQADLKETEAQLLRQKGRLYTLQQKLKTLREAGPIIATHRIDEQYPIDKGPFFENAVAKPEMEPDNAGPSFDQAFAHLASRVQDQLEEPIDNADPRFEIAFAHLASRIQPELEPIDNADPRFEIDFAHLASRIQQELEDPIDNAGPSFDIAFAHIINNNRLEATEAVEDLALAVKNLLGTDYDDEPTAEAVLRQAIHQALIKQWPDDDLSNATLELNFTESRLIAVSSAHLAPNNQLVHGLAIQRVDGQIIDSKRQPFSTDKAAHQQAQQWLNDGLTAPLTEENPTTEATENGIVFQLERFIRTGKSNQPELNETIRHDFVQQWPSDEVLLSNAILELNVLKQPVETKASPTGIKYRCVAATLSEQQGKKPFIVHGLAYAFDEQGQPLGVSKEKRSYVRAKNAHQKIHKWLSGENK